LGEETNTCLTTTSFQAVAESDKVPPQPPLLQTEQIQLPQPLLITAMNRVSSLMEQKERCPAPRNRKKGRFWLDTARTPVQD